jgi:hypothetical protein
LFLNDTIERLLLIVFGWLLGLLGPGIAKAIQQRRENALGRRAIRTELRDLAHKLVYSYFEIKLHQGRTTRNDLEWIKQHLESHSSFEDSSSVLKHVNARLRLKDDQLIDMNRQSAEKPGVALELQRFPVPLLDARVAALWAFDTDLQRTLLEIRTRIAQLDCLVDKCHKYADRTFTSLTPENYNRLCENIATTWEQYAKTAHIIVDQINKIERK